MSIHSFKPFTVKHMSSGPKKVQKISKYKLKIT
jgi:hypothetical protein